MRLKDEMRFDEDTGKILQIIDKGNDCDERVNICDAQRSNVGFVRFSPFFDFNEEEKYDAMDENAKKTYIKEEAFIFIFDNVSKNIDNLKEQDAYQKICNRIKENYPYMEIADREVLLFAILHEMGHWIHFCELGKCPYKLFALKEQDCEEKASSIADNLFARYYKQLMRALPATQKH